MAEMAQTRISRKVKTQMKEKTIPIHKERLIKNFQRLVSIDAPSFGERRMADVLKEELESLGFTVEEDDGGSIYGGTAGNVYAFRKGTLPGTPILFSTHMDTVEPSGGKKALVGGDGRITSDGTTVLGADCMSGTAALLEALKELSEEGADCRDLEIVFFIGEEKHLKGSAVFDFSKVKVEPLFEEFVDFDTFSKSDFRAVKVKECVAVPKSKKLLQFTLDDGTGTDRTILSGIHSFYEPEELVGKTLIAITNLPPRAMMGIDSCGMLLSAIHEEEGEEKLHLLMVDDRIPAGAKLY